MRPHWEVTNFYIPRHTLADLKYLCSENFPASRGLFSFCILWVDEYRIRELCYESKLTVLSMRGGYLATESSRDTSRCVGSFNNSGITETECAGHSGLKSPSRNISWGMRFEECRPRLWTAVGSEWVSTNQGRGLLSRTRLLSERKRKVTSANRESEIQQ